MSALIRQLRRHDSRSGQSGHSIRPEEGWSSAEPEPHSGKVTVFDPLADLRIGQATNRLNALEAEVTNLRHELLEAERTIKLLEQLLHNMQIREREFRRELMEDRH
ncbi:MAG: hypothetical protein ACK562_13925 [Acidobacteriota bacterium]|jgi:hypothetical protein